ncbi:MAG TPA: CARDB domain-containing protein [Thermoanaerobaculia bacterium]|nr:CARDB domain-containing protein [Thermoanaerobaculia bacterium]
MAARPAARGSSGAEPDRCSRRGNAARGARRGGDEPIRLDAPAGPELAKDALPGLAAGAQHTSSGHLWLKGGTWTLYVGVDNDFVVAESDEQNNLRHVRVRVNGRCE